MESPLHDFDQQLCWHVAYNAKELLASPEYPEFRGFLDPLLLSFVEETTFGSHLLSGPRLLFTEYDFLHLEWVAGLLRCRRRWFSFPQIIERWYGCTAEIRPRLTAHLTTRWWAACEPMEEKLCSWPLLYQDGVGLIKEWARTIRHYLQAVGKGNLVPAPDGRFPTPGQRRSDTGHEPAATERNDRLTAHPVPSPGGNAGAHAGHPAHQSGAFRLCDGPQASAPDFLSIARDIGRIADALAPPRPDLVDTPYVARRLGCTATWVAEMVRQGEVPSNCVVPGTGNGKPWKFYRTRIEGWLAGR